VLYASFVARRLRRLAQRKLVRASFSNLRTMTFAVLCSGQGNQHPGMLSLLQNDVSASEAFDAAARELGFDLRDVVAGSADLFDNILAQPLICVAQCAAWHAVREALPSPLAFAGYSVGELASYACAGALSVHELAHLARERAQIMQAAAKTPGGLVALRGLYRPQVDALCRDNGLWVAIVIDDAGFVLGGSRRAIDRCIDEARSKGAQITCLRVGIASHTPLLEDAVDRFRGVLERSSLSDSRIAVLSGTDASLIRDRSAAIDALARQIAQTIDWARCLDALYERGSRVFLELGPGNALARNVQARFESVEARSLDDFRSLSAAVDWVKNRVAVKCT
jgi:[acyl-carrier-protein] S-malonyltransferase